MRALLAAWVLLASLALPAHGHDPTPSVSPLDAACDVCVAAHQLASGAPAPITPGVLVVERAAPLSPEAALPAPLDSPPRLGRAPPVDPVRT
jgi:hypothetical protein